MSILESSFYFEQIKHLSLHPYLNGNNKELLLIVGGLSLAVLSIFYLG